MTRENYKTIENHMLSLMQDSAHDKEHIYRVLYAALDIARHEKDANTDILITACLLHDIGRDKQYENPDLCHAQVGSEMAYEYLLKIKWSAANAAHVRDCISTHRFRGDNIPQSIEAKILFDADKLDASGTMGIARTLLYEGKVSEPLYLLDSDQNIITEGGGKEPSSFFQEYNYKLKKVYVNFYTERAKTIAASRQKTATDFYNKLYKEIDENYKTGLSNLLTLLID